MTDSYTSSMSTESAALAVSSSAIKLMSRTSICAIPHEVFPGFFVAGIILYQQAQRAQNIHLARMIRASFDNCQTLLNQAQNSWDPGMWAMKVFELLLYTAHTADGVETQMPQSDSHELGTHIPSTAPHTPGYSFMANPASSEFPAFSGMEISQNMAEMADYMILPTFSHFPLAPSSGSNGTHDLRGR
ncbi:hypothetical protein BDW67DRAFT_186385 [Aspergillus spinulosporus]